MGNTAVHRNSAPVNRLRVSSGIAFLVGPQGAGKGAGDNMDYATLIFIAELIGVSVFSITGALAAQGKRMDILGVVVLGIVTALGGGTIRDITLNAYPIGWVIMGFPNQICLSWLRAV